MKTVVFGDIHSRPHWAKIMDVEQPDKAIFLGDYVSSHESYTESEQITQLAKILELKETDPDNVILLRGNHDLEALCYDWAYCRPHTGPLIHKYMSDRREDFLSLTQWVHVMAVGDRKTICSHAGISQRWLEQVLGLNEFDESVINAMQPNYRFGFNGDMFDSYGTSPQQSCTWIRPEALQKYAVSGYDQIVGHTQTKGKCIEVFSSSGNKLWLCDALQGGGYLVIEDDKYLPKQINIK